MAETVYRVVGGREVRRALRRAGGTELLDQLKGEHRRIAATVERAASADTPRRTGALAASLRSSGTRTMAVVRAGGARRPYAGPVHWGWPGRPNPGRGWRGGPIPANPWISIAAQRTEPTWAARYEAALRALIRRIEHGT